MAALSEMRLCEGPGWGKIAAYAQSAGDRLLYEGCYTDAGGRGVLKRVVVRW